jgi:hypothetical protein
VYLASSSAGAANVVKTNKQAMMAAAAKIEVRMVGGLLTGVKLPVEW